MEEGSLVQDRTMDSHLPDEMLLEIFSFCTLTDLLEYRTVCSRWHQIILNDILMPLHPSNVRERKLKALQEGKFEVSLEKVDCEDRLSKIEVMRVGDSSQYFVLTEADEIESWITAATKKRKLIQEKEARRERKRKKKAKRKLKRKKRVEDGDQDKADRKKHKGRKKKKEKRKHKKKKENIAEVKDELIWTAKVYHARESSRLLWWKEKKVLAYYGGGVVFLLSVDNGELVHRYKTPQRIYFRDFISTPQCLYISMLGMKKCK